MIRKYKWRNSSNIIKQLQKGNIGIMPTSGVYGIFALATPENVELINKIKKSDSDKKISIMFPSVEDVIKNMNIDPSKESLIRENMPGLTTFILKPKTIWVEETGFSDLKDGVGVRVTTNFNLSTIINETGPLLATSANISGEEVITKPEQVREVFFSSERKKSGLKNISFIVNGGTLGTSASTIVSLVKKDLKIIRSHELGIYSKKKTLDKSTKSTKEKNEKKVDIDNKVETNKKNSNSIDKNKDKK